MCHHRKILALLYIIKQNIRGVHDALNSSIVKRTTWDTSMQLEYEECIGSNYFFSISSKFLVKVDIMVASKFSISISIGWVKGSAFIFIKLARSKNTTSEIS
jgi:hypothetical protein